MISSDNSLATTNHRLALEALRSGVPNREAVRILGCRQPRATTTFTNMLDETESNGVGARSSSGMLLSGGFGTGKSHMLAHFQNMALSRGFVCSKVVISKETPLYDLGKVFKSAVEAGQVQGRMGRLIEELGQALDTNSQEYAAFFEWANRAMNEGAIHPMFPASLIVHERYGDLELNAKIESFWGGDQLRVTELRGGLRAIGQLSNYPFRAPKAADLPPQRLRFLLELIKAAGYKGWVVLIDEIELIGSYSILQRGRSYAETARWMGQVSETYSGLVAVGAVTDDFASYVISPDGEKKDRDYIRVRLENNLRWEHIAASAEIGMRLLENECLALAPPSDEDVNIALDSLRQIYGEAYRWDAPKLQSGAGGGGIQARMRYKIRAAINEWDLLRLNLGNPDTMEEVKYQTDYEENRDLERESRDED